MTRPWARMKIVQDALITDEANELALSGWSLSQIEDHTCVSCGSIDMPDYSARGAEVPALMSGRKRGRTTSGYEYDAGHICGKCMSGK